MASVPAMRSGVVEAAGSLRTAWQVTRDQYAFLLVATVLALLVAGSVPFGLAAGPALCGLQLCYLAKADGRRAEWDMLFRGLDYFVPSLVATLVTTGIMVLALVPFIAVYIGGFYLLLSASAEGMPPPFPPELLGVTLLALIGFEFLFQVNLAFFLMFSYVLIADKGLGGVRSLVVSTKAVWRNLGGLVGLFMLASAIGLLAVAVPAAAVWAASSWTWALVSSILLVLLVTVLTLPLLFGAVAVAYRRIFPAEM